MKTIVWALALGGAASVAACSVDTASEEETAGEQLGEVQQAACADGPCGEPGYCGDGYCRSSEGENTCTCPDDCTARCGNGKCDTCGGESWGNCPHDCTASNTNTGEICGDGYCKWDSLGGHETTANCPQDCSCSNCVSSTSSVLYYSRTNASCSYKCQDCSAYYWNGSYWQWYDGACMYNSFGSLYCEFDSVSCYEKWMCCVF